MVPAEADVTITGIRMPPGHATEGLEAARVIREELPGTAIIVLSADVEVNEAMNLPVGGWYTRYLLKTRVTDVTEIIETAGRITAGCPGGGPVPGAGTREGPSAA